MEKQARRKTRPSGIDGYSRDESREAIVRRGMEFDGRTHGFMGMKRLEAVKGGWRLLVFERLPYCAGAG
jgi:hypothetical protein